MADRTVAEVLTAALSLPKEERLGLAEKLLESVNQTTPEWEEAWKAELDRREAASETDCEPWASAHDELEAYAGRP
jgi:putative addiction module component (TIGR02574 family)